MNKEKSKSSSKEVRKFRAFLDANLRGFRISHYLLRPYVYFLLRVYHKSITLQGFDQINWNKPTIFVPSHQNAFMDALLIVAPTKYLPERYLYPLIRADVFEKGILRFIVSEFHMIPVFRPHDRRDIASSNTAVFQLCEDLLVQNHNLLIHAEGSCVPCKTVRSFRKGFSRIAFNAVTSHNGTPDVQVIPVSINYQKITEPGGYVQVIFDQSVSVKKCIEENGENEAKAVAALTQVVEQKVRSNNVHIADSKDYDLADRLFSLLEPLVTKFSVEEKFVKQRQIAEGLNKMPEISKNRLKKSVAEVIEQTKKMGVKPEYLFASPPKWRQLVWYLLMFTVTLPLFVFGFIHHAVLHYSFEWMVKNKIKAKQFKTSARYMLWFVIYPFYYILLGTAAAVVSSNYVIGASYLLFLPLSGIATLKLTNYYITWTNYIKFAALWYRKTPLVEKLIKKRDQIYSEFFSFRFSL